MNTTSRSHLRPTGHVSADGAVGEPATEQLTLLPVASTPARFLLSKDTRERGLRHVAEIRQMLAARVDADSPVELATLHDRAA